MMGLKRFFKLKCMPLWHCNGACPVLYKDLASIGRDAKIERKELPIGKKPSCFSYDLCPECCKCYESEIAERDYIYPSDVRAKSP